MRACGRRNRNAKGSSFTVARGLRRAPGAAALDAHVARKAADAGLDLTFLRTIPGSIGGAGLDVFQGEPDIHPDILSAPNTVLLPHLGSATVETRNAMGLRVVENARAFFAGGDLIDPVV